MCTSGTTGVVSVMSTSKRAEWILHLFVFLQHHCRRCGQIYCGSCCDTKMGLPRMCFVDPVRVCNRCALVTNKESNFFDRQLRTLTSGKENLILSSYFY